jgi:hypothetical protein
MENTSIIVVTDNRRLASDMRASCDRLGYKLYEVPAIADAVEALLVNRDINFLWVSISLINDEEVKTAIPTLKKLYPKLSIWFVGDAVKDTEIPNDTQLYEFLRTNQIGISKYVGTWQDS